MCSQKWNSATGWIRNDSEHKADKAEQHINHHSQQTDHSGVLRNRVYLISVNGYTKRQSAELRQSQQVIGGSGSRSDRLVLENGLYAKLQNCLLHLCEKVRLLINHHSNISLFKFGVLPLRKSWCRFTVISALTGLLFVDDCHNPCTHFHMFQALHAYLVVNRLTSSEHRISSYRVDLLSNLIGPLQSL